MKRWLAILLMMTVFLFSGCAEIMGKIGIGSETEERTSKGEKSAKSEKNNESSGSGFLSGLFGSENAETSVNDLEETEEAESEETLAEQTETDEPDVPAENKQEPAVAEPAASEYLFPSDTRLITEADLSGLTKDEVALILNEIYARHGYIFKMDKFRTYFSQKSWYHPNNNFSDSLLSSIEKSNVDTIVAYQTKMGWR